jgi:hypothetical protein
MVITNVWAVVSLFEHSAEALVFALDDQAEPQTSQLVRQRS